MVLYLLLVMGFILIISKVDQKKSFYVFGFILFIIAAIRYGIGADYFAYYYLYQLLDTSMINELLYGIQTNTQEILFRLIGSLIKGVGFNYQIYVLIFSGINLYFIARLCKRFSKNPTFSLLVYYCFYYFVWTLSGIRQGITISIGMYYLIIAIGKGKFNYKFVLLTLVLCLIHVSALILLLLYLISFVDFNRKQLIIIIFISIAFSLIPIGNVIEDMTFLPLYNRLLPYITNDYSINALISFKNLGRLVFIGFALYHYNSYIKEYPENKKIIDIYLISLCLYFVFKFSELTAARLSVYGKILDIILIPNIYYLYTEKTKKRMMALLISLICILYMSKEVVALKAQTGMITDRKYLIPYINIFNKDQYEFDNIHYYSLGLNEKTDNY